jgi:hypothetical protein
VSSKILSFFQVNCAEWLQYNLSMKKIEEGMLKFIRNGNVTVHEVADLLYKYENYLTNKNQIMLRFDKQLICVPYFKLK